MLATAHQRKHARRRVRRRGAWRLRLLVPIPAWILADAEYDLRTALDD